MKNKEFFERFIEGEEKKAFTLRAPEELWEIAEEGRELIKKNTGKKPSMNAYIQTAMCVLYEEIIKRSK